MTAPIQPTTAPNRAVTGRERFARVTTPLVLLLLIILFYWKITLTYQYDWVWGPDLAQQVLPWFEEEARQFQHSRFPLWDPHTWAGQPLLGQAQPGAAYPLNWLLFLMPRNHAHISMAALQWYFIAIHYMAALFCYLLCRDVGLSRFASLIGGLVFALGAFVGTVLWPQMVNGAVWAPLVFLFLLRIIRGYRPLASAALCGVCWGMSWLSGHHQVPVFITLAAGFTLLYYAIQKRSWRLAATGAIAAGFMFLTAAFQILPAQEYGRLAKRWVSAPQPIAWNEPVPYTVHQAFSTSPLTVFGIVIPGLSDYVNPFVGIVAVALAVMAVATGWQKPEVKLFAALAAGAFAYALGAHNIFQGMIYAVVPFVEKARAPSMALAIFGLGASVLAAFGVDQFAALRDSIWNRRLAWGLIAIGLLIWTAAFCVLVANNFEWHADERVSMTALIAVLAGGLLLAWRNGKVSRRAAPVLLTALLMIELGNVSGSDFADRNNYAQMSWLHGIRSHQDIADFLDRQSRPFRVEMDTEEMGLNWPEYHNFDQLKSYLASLTTNWTQPEFFTPPTRSLFNVRYTIGHAATMPDEQQVLEDYGGIKVFENPHVFPRAWAIHKIVSIRKPSDGHDLIRNSLDDLKSEAFTFDKPTDRGTCASPDAVTVTRYQPQHVTIKANMACDGMVVLSDTFYPGWKATVDKKPAPIQEVNFTMRSVDVPKGLHEIQYVYRPASVYAGASLSAAGILGALTIVVLDRKRRKAIDLSNESRNN